MCLFEKVSVEYVEVIAVYKNFIKPSLFINYLIYLFVVTVFISFNPGVGSMMSLGQM